MLIEPYVGARAIVTDEGHGTVEAIDETGIHVRLDLADKVTLTVRERCYVLPTLNEEIAAAQAAAYVWGRQDAGEAGNTGYSLDFADAFEARRRAFDRQETCFLPNLENAFTQWRDTGAIG